MHCVSGRQPRTVLGNFPGTQDHRFLDGEYLIDDVERNSQRWPDGCGLFQGNGGRVGHAYQNLINLFLRDCAAQKRRPVIQWPQEATKRRAER
jgi:hypothetical protein